MTILEILKDYVDPIVSIITSIALVGISFALACIAIQTYMRDAPKLLLRLRVFRLTFRGEEKFLHLSVEVTNIGYRNSVLRNILIDGDDMLKKFLVDQGSSNTDEIDGKCLKPGESWKLAFGIRKEHAAEIRDANRIYVTELNGNKYPLSKEEQRQLKSDLQKYENEDKQPVA